MPRVTSKGQVTIPHQIRSILSIRSGDEIIFEIDDAKVVLKKKSASIENLKKYVGFLTHLNGKKTDEIIDELRGEANDFGRWYEDTTSPDLCGEIQSSIVLFFAFLRDIQSVNP